jgi:hypothetical protein
MTDLREHLLLRATEVEISGYDHLEYDGHTYTSVYDWLLAVMGELEPAKPERLAIGTRVRFWRKGDHGRPERHGTGTIHTVWGDSYTVTGDSTKCLFRVSEDQVEPLERPR